VRTLVERVEPFPVAVAVEGHNDDTADTAAFAQRLAELGSAADLVAAEGTGAAAAVAGDEDMAELVGFLLVGEGVGVN